MINNSKLDKSKILSKKLFQIIQNKEVELKRENNKITQDSDFTIDYDFEFIKKYLADYIKNNNFFFQNNLKPKGTVFIILSYNEPFIMSIIPILNALVAGNNVIVKPSGKCFNFFDKIWSDTGLIKELDLLLEILNRPNELDIKNIISKSDCVYFFGSFETAQKIYKSCAELFVEFVPEIETADSKIFKFSNPSDKLINNDCKSTLLQSFMHAGQTCQRISGVFVHEDNFDSYKKNIIDNFKNLSKSEREKMIPSNFIIDELYEKKILRDIEMSNPKKIIKSNNDISEIVLEPNSSSDFIKNGYFYPILWIIPFSNTIHLLSLLNNRKFYLGINIQSDDKQFIKSIVENTKFTRYTINTTHSNIRPNEGWGGHWPSGSGGYKNWIEHFSITYKIIS